MRTTAPGQSALLLLDVISRLVERRISYAIIGAFAASFYGWVRASLDADAVVSIRTAEDIAHLCRDLRAQGLNVEHRKGDFDDPVAAVINIQDTFHNRVDLLMGIRGMTQELFDRAQEAQFMDSSIKIVSLEDFIALKIFAGSPRDIQDVMGVLEVSHEKINEGLLKKLASQYGNECAEKLKQLLKEYPLGE
jgi:predicted nucleotidyltransferase